MADPQIASSTPRAVDVEEGKSYVWLCDGSHKGSGFAPLCDGAHKKLP